MRSAAWLQGQWKLSYRAFTSAGKLCAAGVLAFDSRPTDGRSVDGRSLISVRAPFDRGTRYIGPQGGLHAVRISRRGGTFIVDLNPDCIDNNVYVRFRNDGKRSEGEWRYVSDAGLTAQGMVELEEIAR